MRKHQAGDTSPIGETGEGGQKIEGDLRNQYCSPEGRLTIEV